MPKVEVHDVSDLQVTLRVGWMKDRHVEVGVIGPNDVGFFVTLASRHDCQRLIRALQQGRNDVWGKDA